MMKTLIINVFSMLLLMSCHSSDDNTTLLNVPVDEVILTVANETFTVNFNFSAENEQHMSYYDLSKPFAEINTKDDLIDCYKTSRTPFQHGASSYISGGDAIFAMLEYKLAQECFSDDCKSEFRKEVLQLAANHQKAKHKEYNSLFCSNRSGVFLMAVILLKERNSSIKIIDAKTLQQALLCLSDYDMFTKELSELIIECSEKFLNN